MIASALAFSLLIAVPVDKLMHLGDAGCARVLQAGAAALLPVFDQVERTSDRPSSRRLP